MAATVGCASKNYVRQETTPLINKTNELDDLTAKNTNAIKDVDARAQAGIQQVTAKAAEVDQKAQAAADQAGQAQTQADNAVHRVDSLQNTVANLDNYHVVTETAVQFGFDKDNLTKAQQRSTWINWQPTFRTQRATSSRSKVERTPWVMLSTTMVSASVVRMRWFSTLRRRTTFRPTRSI